MQVVDSMEFYTCLSGTKLSPGIVVEIQIQCGGINQPHDLVRRRQITLKLVDQPEHDFAKEARRTLRVSVCQCGAANQCRSQVKMASSMTMESCWEIVK